MPALARLKMYHPGLFDPAGFWWWNIFVVVLTLCAWQFLIQLSFLVTANDTSRRQKSALKQNQLDWFQDDKNPASEEQQVESFLASSTQVLRHREEMR